MTLAGDILLKSERKNSCQRIADGYNGSQGRRIVDVNFDTYQIPRFSWLPDIETVIMDSKESDPQGGGEPAVATMGGVLANAIYDAVGARVCRMPITPDRIKNAVKQASIQRAGSPLK